MGDDGDGERSGRLPGRGWWWSIRREGDGVKVKELQYNVEHAVELPVPSLVSGRESKQCPFWLRTVRLTLQAARCRSSSRAS